MAKQLFNPNLTDRPPLDYVPPPSDDDFEFMAGPPDYPIGIPVVRFPRSLNARRNALLMLGAAAGAVVGLFLYSQFAHGAKKHTTVEKQATVNMKHCESGYEVFPEANTTVIYMLSDECSKAKAIDLEQQREFLAKEPIILPPAIKPLEKIEDSLLDEYLKEHETSP